MNEAIEAALARLQEHGLAAGAHVDADQSGPWVELGAATATPTPPAEGEEQLGWGLECEQGHEDECSSASAAADWLARHRHHHG